jgi:hypothetical protein
LAFAKKPALADDRNALHRYHAACAAALGGCGLGGDAGKHDDKQKAELRHRALQWLTVDYAG